MNTDVEKNQLHLNIDENFDHQMSLTKSKVGIQITIHIF